MIKYLGSKRLLVPRIVSVVSALGGGRVMDVFSGTSRVGHALKGAGMQVIANDQLSYAATLARCYVQADADKVRTQVEQVLAELRSVTPAPGYFTETFCEKARFFHPRNGAL
ncbi:MAG: DNA adenine methylase, partial [Ilumatobacter sp.]|nr:DNA adenine methylase [Ilumatobacter sp.]